MKHRIKGVTLALFVALLGCLIAQEPAESLCGKEIPGEGYTINVSCVDLDEVAKFTGAPVSGKWTQFLVTPHNQDAYGVAMVAEQAEGKFLKAEPIYSQPDGLKKAMIQFSGMGWRIEHVQIIAKGAQ